MLNHQSLYDAVTRNLVFDLLTMQEREWRGYARWYDHRHGLECDDEGLGAVTCNVAYDIQGI